MTEKPTSTGEEGLADGGKGPRQGASDSAEGIELPGNRRADPGDGGDGAERPRATEGADAADSARTTDRAAGATDGKDQIDAAAAMDATDTTPGADPVAAGEAAGAAVPAVRRGSEPSRSAVNASAHARPAPSGDGESAGEAVPAPTDDGEPGDVALDAHAAARDAAPDGAGLPDGTREPPAQLAARIANGDADAREELRDRYYDQVRLMMSVRCCGDRAQAEDLVNETFRILLENLGRNMLRNHAALPAYVVRTARNVWIAHVRRERSRGTFPDTDALDAQPAADLSPEERYAQEQLARLVHEAIAGLRVARDREVVRRYFLFDQDKQVICRLLDLSSSNFDNVIWRAKARLRKILNDVKGDPDAH